MSVERSLVTQEAEIRQAPAHLALVTQASDWHPENTVACLDAIINAGHAAHELGIGKVTIDATAARATDIISFIGQVHSNTTPHEFAMHGMNLRFATGPRLREAFTHELDDIEQGTNKAATVVEIATIADSTRIPDFVVYTGIDQLPQQPTYDAQSVPVSIPFSGEWPADAASAYGLNHKKISQLIKGHFIPPTP